MDDETNLNFLRARLDRETFLNQPGELLMLGPSGIAKSRILGAKICRLLETGVPPEAVLVLSATSRSPRELVDRIAANDPRAARIPCDTVFGYLLKVLREFHRI